MPYNYRRRYRRNYRRYPRKGNGNMDLVRTAKAAYRGVRYLRSIVNVEKFALESNDSVVFDNSTGYLSCMNLIAQGDGEGTRTGNSIKMDSVHLNYKVSINSAATHTTARVIMFLYKQSQGATPTTSFLFSTPSINGVYSHDNAGLYQVLYDQCHTMSITGQQEYCKSVTRKFYNLHQTFDATTAAVASIQTNSLWILCISDEATNTPQILWRSQYMYYDN